MADPRAGASDLLNHARETRVAMVFGPEQSGLTNEDLGRCNLVVQIPANPAYSSLNVSSLNVAMAVQVVCYELRMAALEHQADAEPGTRGFEIQTPAAAQPATPQQLDAQEASLVDAAQADAQPVDPVRAGPEAARQVQAGPVRASRKHESPESPPATAGELEGFSTTWKRPSARRDS